MVAPREYAARHPRERGGSSLIRSAEGLLQTCGPLRRTTPKLPLASMRKGGTNTKVVHPGRFVRRAQVFGKPARYGTRGVASPSNLPPAEHAGYIWYASPHFP